MDTKKYWLRFGITTLILYIVISAMLYGLYVHCEVIRPDDFGAVWANECLEISLPTFFPFVLIALIVDGSLLMNIPLVVIIVINAILWFLIGSIIGLIYGKIKNRKHNII